MSVTIVLTGLRSPGEPETRAIADIEVDYNGVVYLWQVYIPSNTNSISEYLDSVSSLITADIDAKEALWAASDKTGNKSDVVCPTIPDYYAQRREAYPAIGDQLGSLWKGPSDPDYIAMVKKIADIKANIPKTAL